MDCCYNLANSDFSYRAYMDFADEKTISTMIIVSDWRNTNIDGGNNPPTVKLYLSSSTSSSLDTSLSSSNLLYTNTLSTNGLTQIIDFKGEPKTEVKRLIIEVSCTSNCEARNTIRINEIVCYSETLVPRAQFEADDNMIVAEG